MPKYENFALKYLHCKKSLKIPKGQSESVYRRRTDNTMAKIKIKQKEKQRSTKHTYKTKDRTPLKTGGDLMCSGRVGSSCSTSDTRRVNLVKYVYIIPMSMSLLIPGIVFSANKNKSRKL